MNLLIRIMVIINPYLNDNAVKFHALYNILYASSFQLATFINHSRFLVSIDLQNETVFFMDTGYTKCFNVFKEFHLIKWDIGGDRDWIKQTLK